MIILCFRGVPIFRRIFFARLSRRFCHFIDQNFGLIQFILCRTQRIIGRIDGIFCRIVGRLGRFHRFQSRNLRIHRLKFFIHSGNIGITIIFLRLHHHFGIGKLGRPAIRHPDKMFIPCFLVCFKISETLRHHFLFQESQLGLIRRLRGRISTVIGNQTFELIVTIEKLAVDRFGFAVSIGNIAVAFDRRHPASVRTDSTRHRHCLFAMNPRLRLAVHHDFGRRILHRIAHIKTVGKSISQMARPGFCLPGGFHGHRPVIRAKIHIAITHQFRMFPDHKGGRCDCFSQRILSACNRDKCDR